MKLTAQGLGLVPQLVERLKTCTAAIDAPRATPFDVGPAPAAMPAVRFTLGADSLGYISLEGMVAATMQPVAQLCTACFTGSYPIELPPSASLGKHLLEQSELPLGAPEDGLRTLLSTTGGATALEQP